MSTSSVGAKIELLKVFGLTLGDVFNLNRLAIQAADMSQSSNGGQAEFKIGAAVMTAQGNIYQGCNMEAPGFASAYGTSLTAEDCAIFKALSDGQREIKAISLHVKHLEMIAINAPGQQQTASAVTTPVGLLNTSSGGVIISPRLSH